MIKKAIILVTLIFSFSSCVVVKEYEKVNLSDPDMSLTQKKIDRFETAFQVYREGASGANGGKSGGGCGCN
ncbi:MAG: hypothetical protein ACI9NI_001922 [Olleya marilimosa]|jgi:hypothetical protein|uniref:DUF4266 domain-containing protein n=1 Tax=Olleya TaxID=336276 RepID=UPI000488C162|nr:MULTISPECIES: DUF4266 domain-containing protein [Olleya]MBD3889388.1 DUF4266 domain-containing protein [Olleya marilimosa]PIB31846.1 arginine decarboxylase [Gaetbulibacter sp. 5U11]TVZ46432.1 uncharacterized protein DUF4266 [Olleya sp. Hel_I_94]|tara:strand:+ start:26707 stop:26919 length:213 start_codon:yes stop_codon:yes gene_type:complete